MQPSMQDVEMQVVLDDAGLPLPRYAHPGDSGLDVASAVDLVLEPGQRALLPTGLRVAVPEGFEVQVRPRSGLATRQGLTVLNAPGTIDSGYRGPLKVLLINLGQEPVAIGRGQWIAQLVVTPVLRARLKLVDELPPSPRGEGGFGSTGR
jgi:dUTP pyrophosphatase